MQARGSSRSPLSRLALALALVWCSSLARVCRCATPGSTPPPLETFVSLGEGACAVNDTLARVCYYSFAGASTCRDSCVNGTFANGTSAAEQCIGFSTAFDDKLGIHECYLYGYADECPEADGQPGLPSKQSTSDFSHINNVIIVFITGLECNLKLSFVEEHSIAFTSDGGALCLRSQSNFCDQYSCYDCACVGKEGIIAAEKVCASSQSVADESIPAKNLKTKDSCDNMVCYDTTGKQLEEPAKDEQSYFKMGDGVCAVEPSISPGDPEIVQSCLYTGVLTDQECEDLCTAYTTSEEAQIFNFGCFAYTRLQAGTENECYLFGLYSWCPALNGHSSGTVIHGSTDYAKMTTTLLPTAECTTDCSSTGCMIQEAWYRDEMLMKPRGAELALLALVLVGGALAGAICYKVKRDEKEGNDDPLNLEMDLKSDSHAFSSSSSSSAEVHL